MYIRKSKIVNCKDCNSPFETVHAFLCEDCFIKRRVDNARKNLIPNKVVLYKPSQEIDKLIKQVYTNPNRERNDVALLAKKIKWPYDIVYKRAKKLGFTKPRNEYEWSKLETKILLKNQDLDLDLDQIFLKLKDAGFNRTISGIKKKLTKLRLKYRVNNYNCATLALGFGLAESTVQNWVKKDLIKAKKIGEHFCIKVEDIKEFIQNNPNKFDISKVDQLWFLDIIFDGKIGNYDTVERIYS